MKALIVEVKEKYAVVLKKDGTFSKIRNNGKLSVGCEADIPSGTLLMLPKVMRTAAAAAAFVIVAGMGYAAYSYSTPYSFVSVDINPSVEITANIYDRILKVEALNDDGKTLIGTVDLRNKKLSEGLQNIVEASIDKGYLNQENTNAMMITISSNDGKKADNLGQEIEKFTSSELEQARIETEILVEKASVEEHDQARRMGITPGKLNLIEKLEEARPEINSEDYKDAPVKDIMKEIKKAGKKGKPNEGGTDKKEAVNGGGYDENENVPKAADESTSASAAAQGSNKYEKQQPPGQGKKFSPGLKEEQGRKDNENQSDKKIGTVKESTNEKKNTNEPKGNDKGKKNHSSNKSWIEQRIDDVLKAVGIDETDTGDKAKNGWDDNSHDKDKENN